MKHIFACMFVGLLSPPAHAQDLNANPTGALITPNSDIIVFDQPPTGAFKAPPVPTGVLQPDSGTATWFGLQPDPGTRSGYSPNGVVTPVPGQLPITGYVDVYQGDALNRWVQIPPADTGTPGGWVQWGPADQPPQGFTIEGGN